MREEKSGIRETTQRGRRKRKEGRYTRSERPREEAGADSYLLLKRLYAE